MSSANIIYFWLHFDNNAKNLIFAQCSKLQGFNVDRSLFDKAFDLNPQVLVASSGNATAPAQAAQAAGGAEA